LQHDVHVRARRRGCDRLEPSIASQLSHPLDGAGECDDAFTAREVAIRHFLGIANTLDAFRRCRRAQPIAQDPVVLLTKAVEELLLSEVNPFGAHGLAPCPPVLVARVDQCAIQVPQHGSGARRNTGSLIAHR
jgi:hypothetical protein